MPTDSGTEETEHEYALRAANELEEELLRLGPETVVAFIAEPVVGATAGAVPATKGYFKRIREICDKYGVLLILDEVMCGMGRTGTFFACEQDNVRPDIVGNRKRPGWRIPTYRRNAVLRDNSRCDCTRQRVLPTWSHLPWAPYRLRCCECRGSQADGRWFDAPLS